MSERILQDVLENFFGCQRQGGRTGENPNAQQFCKNTQALRVINSVCSDVPKGNCRGRKQHIDIQDRKPLPKYRRIRKNNSKSDKETTDMENMDVCEEIVVSSSAQTTLPSPHTLLTQATESVISLSTKDTFIQDNITVLSSKADVSSSVLTIYISHQQFRLSHHYPSRQLHHHLFRQSHHQLELSQFQLKSLFHRATNHLQLM